MKLDMSKDEALSYTSVPWKPHLWAWLSIILALISIKLTFKNTSSKAEQKTMVACYQTCYTNSTEGSINKSIWKNQQSPTVFLYDFKNHKYWIAVRHYTCYKSTINNKLTFQKVLVFCDCKQSSSQVQLFCLALFCSASAQTVLTRMVGITEYKGHLKLKRLTTERHIKTTLLHPTYIIQATEFKNRDMTTI